MSIKDTLTAALTSVLENSWAVELPPDPQWPASVFEVDTVSEKNWVLGGGYDQHTVIITVFAKTITEMETLQLAIDAAVMAIEGYLDDGESGDATYEGDASVYGFFVTHTIRLPRY